MNFKKRFIWKNITEELPILLPTKKDSQYARSENVLVYFDRNNYAVARYCKGVKSGEPIFYWTSKTPPKYWCHIISPLEDATTKEPEGIEMKAGGVLPNSAEAANHRVTELEQQTEDMQGRNDRDREYLRYALTEVKDQVKEQSQRIIELRANFENLQERLIYIETRILELEDTTNTIVTIVKSARIGFVAVLLGFGTSAIVMSL